MLFALSWKGRPEVRGAVIERFLKSGGRPPEGVKLNGRWHYIGKISGVAIVEADDPQSMARWTLEWNDLMEMDVQLVTTDEQLAPVLAQLAGKQ